MNLLYSKFSDFIHIEKLIFLHDSILVAVSGGVDSVVLLHLMHQYSIEIPIKLSVIHVNHMLRGCESDADEAFVFELCKTYKIPCHSVSVDVSKNMNNRSLEETARDLRYQAFNAYLQKIDFDKVALAHHADDQAETILMHLFKGAGVRGLRGMLPKRDQFIRPLLFASRQEIEDYAKSNQLNFRTDFSNNDTKFLRNNIRVGIMPLLQNRLNFNVSKGIQRSSSILRDVDDYISHEIDNACAQCVCYVSDNEILLDIQTFLEYFSVIQAGILIKIIEDIRSKDFPVRNHELEELQRIIQNRHSGVQTRFNGPIYVTVSQEKLVFQKHVNMPHPVQVCLNQDNSISEFNINLSIKNVLNEQINPEDRKNKNIEYIDADKAKLPFTIRKRMQGDLFFPLGMKQSKKIQDFFVDEKIENYKRDQWPILFDDNQDIVWICGLRLDNRFRITNNTQTIYRLEITPNT